MYDSRKQTEKLNSELDPQVKGSLPWHELASPPPPHRHKIGRRMQPPGKASVCLPQTGGLEASLRLDTLCRTRCSGLGKRLEESNPSERRRGVSKKMMTAPPGSLFVWLLDQMIRMGKRARYLGCLLSAHGNWGRGCKLTPWHHLSTQSLESVQWKGLPRLMLPEWQSAVSHPGVDFAL